MAVAACPKPETLAAFARGDLGAEELSAVAGHVGVCEACCRSLQLIPDDSLAGLARAAAVSPATVHSSGAPKPLLPAALVQTANRVPDGFANHPRYRILSELGAGGMGTVYKVHDEAMDRIVALKVVSPQLTAKASALDRFRKEVRAAAQLEHPHIIRAYDTGEAGGAQFLVMEYVEGISLDKLVAKKGPLPVNMACLFVRQAALGLQHAADKGMTHRDIKPQNIMVTRKGQVKILDFGLARFARSEEEPAPAAKLPFGAGQAAQNAGVTNPNLLMGTPDYLSPEQAKNSHDVDPRSDIYSLGCTLYYLLTGQPPFASASTLIDKLLAHTNDEPPPIRVQRFEVTEGLAAVLAKMMAKKPEDRYQSAREAADALYPHTRSPEAEPQFEVVEAVAITPAPAVTGTAVAPAPVVAELAGDTSPPEVPTLADTPRPKKRKKPKKRGSWWQKWKWGVVSGVAALVLLVAAVVIGGKKHAEPPKDTPADHSSAKTNSPGQGKVDKTDKASKGEKTNPWNPPTVIGPPKDEIVILYVIPSQGVMVPDYQDVRAWLVQQRPGKKTVRIETASTSGDKSQPAVGPGPSDPIAVDVRLTEGMNLSKYSAVIFCGFNVDEYTKPTGAGYRAVSDVLKRMTGKPVAAICAGQAVLASHDILKNRKVAIAPRLYGEAKFQTMFNDPAIKWQKWPVVVDESGSRAVITAAGPPQAREFADAILTAIEGK